jgi:hypothetical protein
VDSSGAATNSLIRHFDTCLDAVEEHLGERCVLRRVANEYSNTIHHFHSLQVLSSAAWNVLGAKTAADVLFS